MKKYALETSPKKLLANLSLPMISREGGRGGGVEASIPRDLFKYNITKNVVVGILDYLLYHRSFVLAVALNFV